MARYRLSLRDSRHRRVPPEIARERRGRRRLPRGEKIISVTIGIGLAEADERRRKPAEVIARADAALYRAKREGRNRVTH